MSESDAAPPIPSAADESGSWQFDGHATKAVQGTFLFISLSGNRSNTTLRLCKDVKGDDELISRVPTKTNAELKSIWTEIGWNDAEQAERIDAIREAVIRCFTGAVEENRSALNNLREEIETHQANIAKLKEELGMPVDDSSSSKTDECESTSLNSKVTYLRGLVDALQAEKDVWVKKIGEQRDVLVALCETLGKSVPSTLREIGSLTEARVNEFVSEIRGNEVEMTNRTESVCRLIAEIRAFWEELEVTPTSELDRRIAKFDSDDETTALGLTMEVIEGLSACAADLAEQKTKRLDEVRSLGAEITKLWNQLKISSDEQEAFKNSHVGIGMATVKACETELLRLRKIKQERLVSLVKELKETVTDLHEKAHAGPKEKQKYETMVRLNKSSNDKLYDALDSYISTLHKKIERLSPLLESIRKWKGLIEERVTYDNLIKDPSRLLSRRSGKDLAKELKMAKRVTKLLPKLAARVKAKVIAWEKENDELWVDGKHFIDHMTHVEETYIQETNARKEKKKAEKKKKMKSDLRFGSRPAKRRHNPDQKAARKTLAPDGRPKWKGTPLQSRNQKKPGRATLNVCRLSRRTAKEN